MATAAETISGRRYKKYIGIYECQIDRERFKVLLITSRGLRPTDRQTHCCPDHPDAQWARRIGVLHPVRKEENISF